MHDYNQAIIGFGLVTLTCFILIIALITDIDIGCHVIGTEVNGDLTTEYMLVGDC